MSPQTPAGGNNLKFSILHQTGARQAFKAYSLNRKVGGEGPEKQSLMSVGERVLSLHGGEGPVCPGFQKEGTQRAGRMAKP